MLPVVVLAMTMQRWADAEKELERVAEIIAVVTIESVGAIIDGELGAKTDVESVAMPKVADVTEGVRAYGKDARVSRRI